jgi:shikimate 5-dehydrogenase
MKVGLLGTGFGIAHAHIYHAHPEVNEVVVFGRTPAKLQAFAEKFGYATTTEVAGIYDDPAIDLVGGKLLIGAVQALGCLHHRRVQEGPPWTGSCSSSTSACAHDRWVVLRTTGR